MIATRILSFISSFLAHTNVRVVRALIATFFDEALQLGGAMRSRMRGEHSLTRTLADRAALTLRQHAQNLQHIFRRPGDQNLFVGLKEFAQARPIVADDRNSARRSLEEAHARRIAGANHVRSGDIERETLCVVKRAMLPRLEMHYALDV